MSGYLIQNKQIAASVILDISLLHLFIYSGTGIGSGLVTLVMISVAAGNILIQGRTGILFAAFAAIASLMVEIMLTVENKAGSGQWVQAGLFGGGYFICAFLLQNISRRISQSEQLAHTRGQDLRELEKINHQIIQRMHTGIIVVDSTLRIKIANESAKALLGHYPLLRVPSPLAHRIQQWRQAPGIRTSTFQMSDSLPLVQANFSHLQRESGEEILVFLEDTRKLTQQAQQLKLASLGRLTASIAHEIRNPLGAISHAAQLLSESPNLDKADSKMTHIIQKHSKRVNNIIENVLDLSRRGQPQYEEVALNSWLQKIVHSYIETHQPSPNITLQLSEQNPVARFDSSQLEQVLTNLMDNGLRYSKQQCGREVLTLRTGITRMSQQAYVDIIDQGMGIPEDRKQQLFEPFFTSEPQGTGLGLYLSRELCEANQAQLNLKELTDKQSEYTKGACFRITFAHRKKII
jgi:two-component system sensor histidine kinase PilS (NtrC family)